ncbi:hypothetical protein AB1Y20_010707 [Prymnesium parvum]|uniref:Inosine/uridine-preferring nucleoside hydrolase domain-containing protein n=1 Tax=Prymnesium parvum TaxID=97485 RepID=A0AB34IQI4_PRYPA
MRAAPHLAAADEADVEAEIGGERTPRKAGLRVLAGAAAAMVGGALCGATMAAAGLLLTYRLSPPFERSRPPPAVAPSTPPYPGRPPLPPPPPSSPAGPPPTVWEHRHGLNCSGGGYGAFNVALPSQPFGILRANAPVAGADSVRKCMDACVRVDGFGCEAVLFETASGRCYHRRYVNIDRCSPDEGLELFLRTDRRPPSMATPLIIDTDLSFDVDDVGAVCMAHALHDLGEASLLAILHDSGYPHGIGAVSVLSHYYGHDDIPLGAYKGEFGRVRDDYGAQGMLDFEPKVPGEWVTGDYAPTLVKGWPAPVTHRDQVADAVEVYREVLAKAADHSVVIAAIGFATNLAPLLRSGPDVASPLSGKRLVARKVKRVVWQGGWYPARHPAGEVQGAAGDFNWGCGEPWYNTSHCKGEAQFAVSNMPDEVEQVFSEVGYFIGTGGKDVHQCTDASNPCRQAYITNMKAWGIDPDLGRASWDAVVTLAAVRGVERIESYKGGVGGRNNIRPDGGTDEWINATAAGGTPSQQSYLVLAGDQSWRDVEHNSTDVGKAARESLRMEIDRLLCKPRVLN